MKILYLDLGMGAAGDMLTAALLDSMNEEDKTEAIKEISLLGIPDVTFDVEKSVKCGIMGTHVSVKVHGVDESEGLYEWHEHGENGHEHHIHDEDGCFDNERSKNENEHSHHGHGEDGYEYHAHGNKVTEHNHLENREDGYGCHVHDVNEHGHDCHEHDADGHEHKHHHHHSNLQKINDIVDSLNVSDEIKTDVKAIYKILAEAEGHVHDRPVTEIHFHEVGTMDAVADITATCLLIRKIGADKILASPIHVGSGQVRCAHGILPVPAPATAYILKGIPMYSTELKGELCTPTGAAILKYFVDEFGPMPAMTSDGIGYGMGYKDFERANCVRAIVGTDIEARSDIVLNHIKSAPGQESGQNQSLTTDSIIELRCNIDDMTGEEIGFAFEQLLSAGARDVFTTPITMKKNRPGVLLTVICSATDKDTMVRNIFKYTTTIGIRETICNRYILDRTSKTLNTPLGQVREKRVSGYGVERSKLEYDDIATIARNTGMSLMEVKDSIYKN